MVGRTLNEWSDWQLKNLNAIVWLYRSEVGNTRPCRTNARQNAVLEARLAIVKETD